MSETPIYEVPLSALEGGTHLARAGSREILIVSTDDGLRVWDGVCPHLAGPLLEGRVTRSRIVCPWHGYVFDCATGRCQTVPGRMWKAVDSSLSSPTSREPLPIALRPLRHEIAGEVVRVYGA